MIEYDPLYDPNTWYIDNQSCVRVDSTNELVAVFHDDWDAEAYIKKCMVFGPDF